MSQLVKQITRYSDHPDVHLQQRQRDIQYIRFIGQITKGLSLAFAIIFGVVALLQMTYPSEALPGISREALTFIAVGLSAFFLGIYFALALSTGISVSIQRIHASSASASKGGCDAP